MVGSGDDRANGIAVDNSGNVYVGGATLSTDFPTYNALQPKSGGGNFDAFLAEIVGLWRNATDLGNNWMELGGFGNFNTGSYL